MRGATRNHLRRGFSFSVIREEFRRDFRNRGFVVAGRSGGRGSRRRGRLGGIASGQLWRGHVLIEVSILIVCFLFQLAPPCGRTGVLRLLVLVLDQASMQASRSAEERKEGDAKIK